MAKSIVAVVLGLISIIFLSVGTDLLMRRFGILAVNGSLMSSNQFLLAFAYRVLISIFGCYLAARLAPNRPMKHALALGVVGLVFSALGVVASYARPDLGPHWYPIALLVITLPCAWAGGMLGLAKTSVSR